MLCVEVNLAFEVILIIQFLGATVFHGGKRILYKKSLGVLTGIFHNLGRQLAKRPRLLPIDVLRVKLDTCL